MAQPVNRPQPPGSAPAPDARLYLRDRELDQGAALIRAAARTLSQLVSAAGVAEPEMEIVQEIFDRGSMDVGELRSRLGAPKQTLARHLNDLEARGLLKRTTDVKDRRRRLVTLTQEGETFAYAQTQQRRAAIRRAFLSAGPEAVAGARGVLSAIIQDDSQT